MATGTLITTGDRILEEIRREDSALSLAGVIASVLDELHDSKDWRRSAIIHGITKHMVGIAKGIGLRPPKPGESEHDYFAEVLA